jgi:hypothetical protein
MESTKSLYVERFLCEGDERFFLFLGVHEILGATSLLMENC